MEKRLKLAKRLLKPDGVIIVTIDANEVHHLGLLLEQLFPEARRQVVSICINPSGASGEGLSRVDEYAFFCFFGGSGPVAVPDDMLTETTAAREVAIRRESLMRGGNTWYRASRTNLCYPIILDPEGKRIVNVGKPLPFHDEREADEREERERPTEIDGCPVVWPVRLDGKLGIWRVEAAKLMQLAGKGYAYVSSRDTQRGTWTIRYLLSGTISAINSGLIEVIGTGDRGEALLRRTSTRRTTAKTMWHRGRHTAGGAGGTHMLVTLLGQRDVFPFPKSVYAVRDCIEVAIGDRRDALIVDFFAGSGTTFHATCLLNADDSDSGERRSILVTNNEVSDEVARDLNRNHYYRGDPEFDAYGIFERATKPRCTAVVTGQRPDGTAIPGEYPDGRLFSDGFPENIEFFQLDYLDPDEVDLGHQFDAIVPALWLSAGGIGQHEGQSTASEGFSIPATSTYGVLFKESRFRQFKHALAQRPDVTHVWLVTDSEDAFAEMRSALPVGVAASMLYRDYLRNFRINTERNI